MSLIKMNPKIEKIDIQYLWRVKQKYSLIRREPEYFRLQK